MGILRVARESIFSGLNNIKVNSILEDDYSQYFGFTPEEVRDMAKYYGVPERYEEICKWYDGYRFGESHIFHVCMKSMAFSDIIFLLDRTYVL